MVTKVLGVGLLLIGLVWQGFPICRPLKEDESYQMKTLRSVTRDGKKVVEDGVYEHKCIEIDDHGIEHIEATCTEGTVKRGDDEPESTKGEYYNYFQNSRGQRFEYEDIRASAKEDPVNYLFEEIRSKLKESTVLRDETWKDKSTNTEYSITSGQPKQFMKTECIEVIRKGTFTNGITGEFKEDSWYRTSDGQLMYRQTTADHVVVFDGPAIDLLERVEFLPNKT